MATATQEQRSAAPPVRGEYRCECGHVLRVFGGRLAGAGRTTPGWTSSSVAGRATFTQPSSGLSFSVTKQR